MQIEDNRSRCSTRFDNLKGGEVFEFDNKVYIKSSRNIGEGVIINYPYYNSVRVYDGEPYFIPKDTYVNFLTDSKIVIT